jgi:hypothetical protein
MNKIGGLAELKHDKWERVAGIEPAWPVWKTGTLPLSYTRETVRHLASEGGDDKRFLPAR